MFKAQGDTVLGRLTEHIRSRGFGRHVSVAVSPKGSYREPDVVHFLDQHLPHMSEGRRWRIMMADDFSSHKGSNVWRLCWLRGYVFVLHGGGNTPVAQTVDTDLNQHVRREYSSLEAAALLRKMRTGVIVPSASEGERLDMLEEVWGRRLLHIKASEGYKSTGATVALDGTEDHLIVREAGTFWHELGMREKINREVAQVRREVEAGRLGWSAADVQGLILPYPKNKEVDSMMEKMRDDTELEAGEVPFATDTPGDGSVASSDASSEEIEGDDSTAVAAVPGGCPEVAELSSPSTLGDIREEELTADEARHAHESNDLMRAYESAMAELKRVGAVGAVVTLENEIRKEKRRIRGASKESAAVAVGLARLRDAEEAEMRKKQKQADALNEQQLTAAKLKREVECANKKIRDSRAQLREMESLLEVKHAVKSFNLLSLGQGSVRAARLGSGLSAAQRNDWKWFQEQWDAKMLAEHTENWGQTFASWIQHILNKLEAGESNSFSLFVHSETERCFGDEVTLTMP
jgi:hypothetical protein